MNLNEEEEIKGWRDGFECRGDDVYVGNTGWRLLAMQCLRDLGS